MREPDGSQWSRCIFFICTKYARSIKSVYVEGLASRERLYDQRTKSFQLRPIRGTFSLYHAFSYSLDLEGRTYERGLIAGYCDSLDVRSFPATGPIADDSQKSTQRQTSGRVVSSRFSLPLRDERSRTSNRKKNRFAKRAIALPVTRFPTFRPPSRALPTSKKLLFAVDFVHDNGTRVFDRLFIFSEMCQKCKDYSYISFDAFQT